MLARLRSLAPLLLLSVLAPACAVVPDDAADTGEPADDESALVAMTEPDETAPASSLAPAPLDATASAELLDIRGMGDSGWSNTHEKTPIVAAFGEALDRFDSTGHG
jgi:hypothetical protein